MLARRRRPRPRLSPPRRRPRGLEARLHSAVRQVATGKRSAPGQEPPPLPVSCTHVVGGLAVCGQPGMASIPIGLVADSDHAGQRVVRRVAGVERRPPSIFPLEQA